MELRNALNDKFGVELSPTVTLDYPSVAALAVHIAEQLSQAAGIVESDDEAQVEIQYDLNSTVHLLFRATKRVWS